MGFDRVTRWTPFERCRRGLFPREQQHRGDRVRLAAMGSDNEAMGLRAVPGIWEKDHDEVRRRRLRALRGFFRPQRRRSRDCLEARRGAPAAVKPATTAKPAAATPAATKPTTTAFGTGVWRTVQTTKPNPQTGVWSSDVQYISFGANGKFSEEIVSQGGNGQTGAGGVIDIVGTYKALSKTSMDFTMTSAALCVVYCQAYERSSWGTSLDFTYKTLAPGQVQGAGGAELDRSRAVTGRTWSHRPDCAASPWLWRGGH